MTRVIVRPAGAERETLLVALLALAIVCGAAATAVLRSQPASVTQIQSWQVDARDGLNAAEQGLNADLTVAAGDIALILQSGEAPEPAALAEEGMPPFTADIAAEKRGNHVWTMKAGGDVVAYIGKSGDMSVAGSVLLLVPAHSGHEAPSTWLNRDGSGITALDEAALVAAGWKKIVSTYDASVTREGVE